MYEWERQIQTIVDEIDECIKNRDGEALALASLARRLGYSEFHASRKFREVAGMPLRDYLRRRKLAFALKEVRDTNRSILDIALDHGFSSHEAFTLSLIHILQSQIDALEEEWMEAAEQLG